ncbi:MAG: papain-like cysteine protease family protein [Dehalococcoidia bacterium]
MAEPEAKATGDEKARDTQNVARPESAVGFEQDSAAAESAQFDWLLGASATEPSLERHTTILGDPRFSQRGNAFQKARIMEGLQRRYGNAYAQRVISRFAGEQSSGNQQKAAGTGSRVDQKGLEATRFEGQSATVMRTTDEALLAQGVRYNVPLIPQPTNDSCWAGSMAMIESYHQGTYVSPNDIANSAGVDLNMSYGWGVLYDAALYFGFHQLPAQSLPPESWARILDTYGPLWIVRTGDPSHAIVLTGIKGNNVYVNDPWPPRQGTVRVRTFAEFAESFGGAAEAVGNNMQILYGT